jgi:hypothetical protein
MRNCLLAALLVLLPRADFERWSRVVKAANIRPD